MKTVNKLAYKFGWPVIHFLMVYALILVTAYTLVGYGFTKIGWTVHILGWMWAWSPVTRDVMAKLRKKAARTSRA